MEINKQQDESAEQIVFAVPVNALESLPLPTASHISSSPSSLGGMPDLTPTVTGRSDLFPCTKKRSWENNGTLIVQLAPDQT